MAEGAAAMEAIGVDGAVAAIVDIQMLDVVEPSSLAGVLVCIDVPEIRAVVACARRDAVRMG